MVTLTVPEIIRRMVITKKMCKSSMDHFLPRIWGKNGRMMEKKGKHNHHNLSSIDSTTTCFSSKM